MPSPLSPAAASRGSVGGEDGSGDLRAVASGAISADAGSPEEYTGRDTGNAIE